MKTIFLILISYTLKVKFQIVFKLFNAYAKIKYK